MDSALPSMAEKLIQKGPELAQKYLELVEFVTFQLQFTPCKELIAISRILKHDIAENYLLDHGGSGNNGKDCDTDKIVAARRKSSFGLGLNDVEHEARLKLKCVRMLLNLTKHNVLFKDVFREVGILEVLITCLHRFGVDVEVPDHRKGEDKQKQTV